MMSLKQIIQDAEAKKVAVGHFNISDLAALKAIFEAALELKLPVIIGTSEGEREFIDPYEAVALVKSLREEHDYPIYLNADHTHSLAKVEEAAKAGYDAILFDGGKLPLAENIAQTKAAVALTRKINPAILIEGELGYIGGSSEVLNKLPEGAAIQPEDLTKPEETARFVKETNVDLLAPAVGNIHGMLANASNPNLDIKRIEQIRKAAGVPLVLHGGSGIADEQFLHAIEAGISVIHINTEIRIAWRKGLEAGLQKNPTEVAPYKIMPEAIEEIRKVVYNRLKLFSRL